MPVHALARPFWVLGLLVAANPAFAADEAASPDVLDDASPPADEKGEEKKTSEPSDAAEGAPAEGAAAAAAEQPPAEETIYVVQAKKFLVRGRFEVAPQVIQSVNDSFTSHTGLAASGIYHLKENVSLELIAGLFAWPDVGGMRLGGHDSDLTTELREKESLAPERVKLYQFPYFLAADAQWSPLYGKVSIQDLVLGQFNLYLSVGAGVFGLQLESQTQNGTTKNFVTLPGAFGIAGAPALAPSTSFGGGLRFYFTDWLGMRVEVRDYVLPLAARETEIDDITDGSTFDVTNLVLGQLGVSFIF